MYTNEGSSIEAITSMFGGRLHDQRLPRSKAILDAEEITGSILQRPPPKAWTRAFPLSGLWPDRRLSVLEVAKQAGFSLDRPPRPASQDLDCAGLRQLQVAAWDYEV